MGRGGRLNKVACVLCQGETLDDDRVCADCRDIHALGKTVLEKQKTDKDQAVIRMPRYRLEVDYHDGVEVLEREREKYEIYPSELARAMGLMEPPEGVRSWQNNEITRSGEMVSLGFSQRQKKGYDSSSSTLFVGTKSQVAAVAAILEKIQNAATYAFHQGFDRGSNLLAGLSRGEVTLDQFDEAKRTRGRTWEM